jgi:predicted  nucleic acid-binding Zn-ribbon protein
MEQIEQIKKLADQITAKRQELESIETEQARCNAVLAATETAKSRLADLKAQRATLLADAFRANKKADTKQIDSDLSTAAETVRIEADKALAASGALVQLQSEAATVSEALRKLERDQRSAAADHCASQFKTAEAAFLQAVEVLGAAYTDMHASHEAMTKLYPHAGADLRELLRNYGSMRIFTPAPHTMRGWDEPTWLAGPGLASISAAGADKLMAGFRAAGATV